MRTTKKLSLLGTVLMSATFMACMSERVEETSPQKQVGTLALSLSAKSAFEIETRAAVVNEQDYKDLANYKVTIQSTDNSASPIVYDGDKLPTEPLKLEYGSYTVTASYGVEHDVSREEFLSYAKSTVTLNDNNREPRINLECKPTCGKLSAEFATSMADYFSAYSIVYTAVVDQKNVSAIWGSTDTTPWYLKVAEAGTEVTATIYLTPQEKYETKAATVVRTYKLERNKGWHLIVEPNYNSSTGTLGLTITVDEKTNDIPLDIVIPAEWL